jgi:serine/threonine-protein kinase HipA
VKKVLVHYAGWGEYWPLGTLADDGQRLLFEYAETALTQGLELSPRHLPLQRLAFGGLPAHQQRLPGLIADSLPDGWGMLLMDRLFRKHGLNPSQCSPLDRLSFIGQRGMGALIYEPATQQDAPAQAIDLHHLARESALIYAGQESEALLQMALLGGSPQGARPKVLIYFNEVTARISTTPFEGGAAWLIKFQAPGEPKEVCAIEALYAQWARLCGLDVPATHLFDLGPQTAAFGIARFDVSGSLRVPVHSLAGLLHADFRIPSAVDYTTLLRATRLITQDEREVQKAFERAVFNVLSHNRDDHPKNFAYRLDAQRQWHLAPCFDLTFSEGPGGEHQMDLCGEGKTIRRHHLMTLAQQGGLDSRWASRRVDEMLQAADLWPDSARGFDLRATTRQHLLQTIARQRDQLMH